MRKVLLRSLKTRAVVVMIALVFGAFGLIGCRNSVHLEPFASLLEAFGVNGVVRTQLASTGIRTNEEGAAMAMQADGKLLMVGFTDASGGNDFAVLRYNSDGSLDTSFNGTGKAATDIINGSYDRAKGIVLQSDGKIVVGGDSASSQYDFALARYNTDGTLDTTFNGNGKTLTDVGTSSSDHASGIALQSDGKILLVGTTQLTTIDDIAVVRYNANGTLDTTFNGTGKLTLDIGASTIDSGAAIAVQADGKILIAGTSTDPVRKEDFVLIRINSDGSLDTTLNGTGVVSTDIATNSVDQASAISIQADGKILLAGSSNPTTAQKFAVVRYNANGTLDTSFNGTGKVITNVSTWISQRANGIAPQADGKIFVFGQDAVESIVARYEANGTLDTTFNSTGVALGYGVGLYTGTGMSVDSQGKVFLSGSAYNAPTWDFRLLRYNADGTLDTAFGNAGVITTDYGTGSSDSANEVVLLNDGKILVAGSSTASGSMDFALIRYNSDGTLDSSFNTSGRVTTGMGTGSYDLTTAVALQNDGKILVAGVSDGQNLNYDFAIVRYNLDGSLDNTFNGNGKLIYDFNASSFDRVSTIKVQSDGKILMAGRTNALGQDDFVLVRLNANGSFDTTFNGTGIKITDIDTSNSYTPTSMALQGDGKILVGGFIGLFGSEDFVLVRFNANGSLDTSFNSTGKVVTDLVSGSGDQAQAIALQSDGKILLAGLSSQSSTSNFALVRYNTNGSLDTSFHSTGIVTTSIGMNTWAEGYALKVLNDGRILVLGDVWESDSSSSSKAVVRYNANGSLDASFNSTGKVTTGFGLNNFATIMGAAIKPDGSFLACGSIYSSVSGKSEISLIRYRADGSH